MKLCFSTLGCPELGFRDMLSIAKDLGYDGVEMRGLLNVIEAPDMREFSHENIEETLRVLKRMGLQIPILTTACYVSKEDIWPETFDMAKRYIDLAARLGSRGIRFLGDVAVGPTLPVDDALVVSHMQEICDYAEGTGVYALLETNGAYADSKRLKSLLGRIGRANVGVVWDINHPYQFFGESAEETFSNLGSYVKHVHLKDSKKTEQGLAYQMMGYGELPIKKCVELLKGSGYDGYYSLEWVKRWNTSLEEPGVAFAVYMNYMSKLK